ncbi:DUF1493 family protein [Fluviicola sp.]|uniref:DUF1493 family protein n=1 Tax=Fluviicola sp. TaxID=1917219 RepID=UPI002625C17A|nr:DUF1493 family protein [Fluviicola sp.]
MNNIIFEQLVSFVFEEACIPKKWGPLSRETYLYKKLGITGDDAIEFLIAYSKRFEVDISKFMAADHFTGEGWTQIFGNEGKKDLSLGDLEKGIIAGRLDRDVIK